MFMYLNIICMCKYLVFYVRSINLNNWNEQYHSNYVCVCVCVYIYIYIYIYICLCMCIYVCVYFFFNRLHVSACSKAITRLYMRIKKYEIYNSNVYKLRC